MATINELATLATPSGSENVVIQNNIGNYKMAYKPTLTKREELTAQSDINSAIGAALNSLRGTYGDCLGYHIQYVAPIPDWPNGILLSVDTAPNGPYIVWYGIAYSQRYGVYAFSRYDTVGGSVGTLRVSQLGTGLA